MKNKKWEKVSEDIKSEILMKEFSKYLMERYEVRQFENNYKIENLSDYLELLEEYYPESLQDKVDSLEHQVRDLTETINKIRNI